METARLGVPAPKRIAVLRALPGLGDMLCVMPALRALRVALPSAHITLIGLPASSEIRARFSHYLDDLLPFPGFPGIPELTPDPARLPRFFAEVQGRFDLALQMHGSGSHSNTFTLLLGAATTAGFCLPSLWCPDPDRFAPYPAHLNEVRRWLKLMEFLQVPPAGEELEFPLVPADEQQLNRTWPQHSEKRYVCIHPGASEVARRWPPERFAVVADVLASKGFLPVLTGTEGEKGVTAEVNRLMRHQALDLAGKTDLGALAVLLKGAELLVCNDTGVSHLAAALHTPSVVIFSASDPGRWAPLDTQRHRAVGEPMPARVNSCRHSAEIKGHRCLRDGCDSLLIEEAGWAPATVEQVLDQVRDLERFRRDSS